MPKRKPMPFYYWDEKRTREVATPALARYARTGQKMAIPKGKK